VLYADDLTLMGSDPDAMQTMLNRLHWYAQRKHLIIINTAMSEVVHFITSGSNMPVFNVGRVPLQYKNSFKSLSKSLALSTRFWASETRFWTLALCTLTTADKRALLSRKRAFLSQKHDWDARFWVRNWPVNPVSGYDVFQAHEHD